MRKILKLKWFAGIILTIAILLFITVPNLISNILRFGPLYLDTLKNPKNIASVIDKFNETEAPEIPDSDCSNITEQWRSDGNVYFEGSKIKLNNDATAGSIFFKDKISGFLNFEILFRSSLKSGINTNISFINNKEGELRYSIGDGDFKTIRSLYLIDQTTEDSKKITLDNEIDNSKDVGFKLDIVERNENSKAISSLTYSNTKNKFTSIDLDDMIIPQNIYLSVGFGLDVNKEPKDSNPYIEIKSCAFKENSPSKILNQ